MPIQYKDFVEKVVERAFPEGEPENLIKPHRQDIVSRLVRLQEACPLYREQHVDVYPHCSTFFWCGATVIDSPPGKIKRLYTLPEEQECCAVFYDYVASYDKFVDWLFATRPNYVLPDNSLRLDHIGFSYANKSQDKGIRYSFGKYTINSGKIYIGHRIESTERIIVEWSGVKRKWKDTDLVGLSIFNEDNNEIDELIIMVADYVLGNHLVTYMPTMAEHGMLLLYKSDSELAELIWKIEKLETPEVITEPRYSNANIYIPNSNCKTDETISSTVFASTSDLQSNSFNVSRVATLISSYNPEFVVLNGDLWLNDNPESDSFVTLDNNIGPNYGKFLFPYKGSLTSQHAERQNLYATLGNHDNLNQNRLIAFLTYFNIPYASDNYQKVTGYYTIERDNVLLVIMDTTTIVNSDINTMQYSVLSRAIVNSKMKWKIVFSHYPFISSLMNDFYAPMWDFKKLGVDVIISGHNHFYERLELDGLNFIVSGTGGATQHRTSLMSPYSKVYIPFKPGALIYNKYKDKLKIDYIDVNGSILDTLEIAK